MQEIAIRNKCIELEFDEDRFDDWVSSITNTDKRVAGLKEYEWNTTVTTEQKHASRIQKKANAEKARERAIQKEARAQKQKEWEER